MRKAQVSARVITLTAGLAVLVPGRRRGERRLPRLGRGAAARRSPAADRAVARTSVSSSRTTAAQTWQWTCERPETSMASAYALGAPPGDRLYSLSLDVGLAFSDDDSCSWRRAGGALATAIATDYFPDPTDAAHVLAIVGAAGGRRASARPPSTNRPTAATASPPTPIYVAPAGAELLGVEIARADPRVIYLAIAAPGPHPMLARSDDAGATLDDARHRAVARRAHRPHHRRRSGRRERHLPARDRRGRRAAGGQPRRRRELRDADHAGGRRAERVRASGERHGAGRRPASRRRRLTTAGVAWRSATAA